MCKLRRISHKRNFTQFVSAGFAGVNTFDKIHKNKIHSYNINENIHVTVQRSRIRIPIEEQGGGGNFGG